MGLTVKTIEVRILYHSLEPSVNACNKKAAIGAIVSGLAIHALASGVLYMKPYLISGTALAKIVSVITTMGWVWIGLTGAGIALGGILCIWLKYRKTIQASNSAEAQPEENRRHEERRQEKIDLSTLRRASMLAKEAENKQQQEAVIVGDLSNREVEAEMTDERENQWAAAYLNDLGAVPSHVLAFLDNQDEESVERKENGERSPSNGERASSPDSTSLLLEDISHMLNAKPVRHKSSKQPRTTRTSVSSNSSVEGDGNNRRTSLEGWHMVPIPQDSRPSPSLSSEQGSSPSPSLLPLADSNLSLEQEGSS